MNLASNFKVISHIYIICAGLEDVVIVNFCHLKFYFHWVFRHFKFLCAGTKSYNHKNSSQSLFTIPHTSPTCWSHPVVNLNHSAFTLAICS